MKRRQRWLRFGYAGVNFGKPVSMRAYCQQQAIDLSALDQAARFDVVTRLSKVLMQEVADVVPILPVALMSEILLSRQSVWSSELELKALAAARIEALEAQGAPIRISANACEGVLTAALAMLEGRGFAERNNGELRANAQTLDVLNYYANSIGQWQEKSVMPALDATP